MSEPEITINRSQYVVWRVVPARWWERYVYVDDCYECDARTARLGPLTIGWRCGLDLPDWRATIERWRCWVLRRPMPQRGGVPPAFIPEVWTAEMIDASPARLVILDTLGRAERAGGKSYLAEAMSLGKTIHINPAPWTPQPFTGADADRWEREKQADIDYGLLGPATNDELDNKGTIAWG